MELTPEERNRIYHEEKAREEIREALRKAKPMSAGIKVCLTIGGIVFALVAYAVIGAADDLNLQRVQRVERNAGDDVMRQGGCSQARSLQPPHDKFITDYIRECEEKGF